MYIFIDTISPVGRLIIYKDFKIVNEKSIDILGSEYSNFLDIFLEFLKESSIDIRDLEGITVVNGPGGFTGTRIIALIVNTIQFVNKTQIQSIDYFTLLEKSGMQYPMIIKANRTEYLYKKELDSKPVVIPKTDIVSGIYSGIGDILDFENTDVSIRGAIDYSKFIQNLEFSPNDARIEPYYIKKPNIT